MALVSACIHIQVLYLIQGKMFLCRDFSVLRQSLLLPACMVVYVCAHVYVCSCVGSFFLVCVCVHVSPVFVVVHQKCYTSAKSQWKNAQNNECIDVAVAPVHMVS
jgi:hypothetical protein